MAHIEPEHTPKGAEGTSRPESDVPDCDLEIFLIGKTGSGKSATGNTILGREKFQVSDSTQSETLETDVGWVERGGLAIKVVDGPGLMDTRMRPSKQLEQMEKNLSKGFVHSPKGFHALVLVMKYGSKFTREEEYTIKVLETMLGKEFIKEHCILAFTDGENFLLHHADRNFTGWCEKQSGQLHSLFKECEDRCVLFYNKTKTERDTSTDKLISMAKKLGKRYTGQLFNDISQQRSEFIQKEGAIQLRPLIEKEIDMIIGYLDRREVGHDLKEQVDKLEGQLKNESQKLKIVKTLNQGIQKIRRKEYAEALAIFEEVQTQGRNFLYQFYKKILIIVRRFRGALRSIFV